MNAGGSRFKQWVQDHFPNLSRMGGGMRPSNYMLLRTAMLTWRFVPMWRDLFRYLSLASQLSYPLTDTVETWLEENRENYQPQQLGHVEELHRHLRDGGELRDYVAAKAPFFIKEVRDLFSVAGSRENTRETLRVAVDLMESHIFFLQRLQDFLSYPIFLLVLAGFVLAIILWKIIPTFAALFLSLGARLPLATRVVVAVSNFLVDQFLVFFILGIVLLALFVRSGKMLRILREFSLQIPMVRRYLYRLERVRLLRALSILARQNRLDLQSLEAVTDYLNIEACKTEWRGFVAALHGGERWSRAIEGITFLTPDITYMLGSFSLEKNPVDIVGVTYALNKQKAQVLTQYLLRAAEPVVLLLLGVFFAFVVFALYAPMFALIGMVQ
jgi:type II secretory pathway component PulF